MTVHVADPGSAGFDLFFWTCASMGQGCLEDQLGLQPRGTTVLGAQGSETVTVEVPDLSAVEGWGEELFPVSLWALVCTASASSSTRNAGLGGSHRRLHHSRTAARWR